MGQNLKESQSLGYILKQRFKKTVDFQTLFLKYFNSFLIKTRDEILSKASELQKFLGKTKTRDSNELKKQLLASISSIEIEVIELIEFLVQYKLLIEKSQNYEINFQSLKRIKEHVENNIETINSINIINKNLCKSANVVFIVGKQSNKKTEDYFDNFIKEYTKLTRRLTRENNIFSEEFQQIVSVLEKEIEITVEKAKQKEEENPA
ncbi:MAG: hypothetical protein E3J70_11175 [Candidatus Heimdallarchaeota archaeon]|nr:MAG: hypothetical protein E3J70_11175 [Candidatus Heimdallarchaeota archaeon]